MEIIKSALTVAFLLLHPRLRIRTTMYRFRVHLPTMNGRVLLANSITLTPGTVTIDIQEENLFTVHALTSAEVPEGMDHTLAIRVGRIYGMNDLNEIITDETILYTESTPG